MKNLINIHFAETRRFVLLDRLFLFALLLFSSRFPSARAKENKNLSLLINLRSRLMTFDYTFVKDGKKPDGRNYSDTIKFSRVCNASR